MKKYWTWALACGLALVLLAGCGSGDTVGSAVPAAGYQVVPEGLDVPIDGAWVRFAPVE